MVHLVINLKELVLLCLLETPTSQLRGKHGTWPLLPPVATADDRKLIYQNVRNNGGILHIMGP